MSDIKSVLELNRLVFDKIEFKRTGFKNNKQSKYEMEAQLSKNTKDDIYKVTLIFKCEKENEYNFEIDLTGFFTFNSKETLDEDTKNTLISKNSVAILMPYMRSQISLLTAQPEVDCVVLPPFNINNFVDKNEDTHE